MIRYLCIESIFATSQRFTESLIQICYKLLVTTHQINQIGYIMRNIPTINPTIILTIIFTGTHTSGETIIEWFDPLTILILRMEESCFCIIHVAIIMSTLQIVSSIFFLSQHIGYTRQAPLVVCCSQCNCNRLTLFEMMYIRVCFFFSFLKCRDISVLLIEIINPTGGSPRPRSQCFFFNSFTASFIGLSQIEL